MINRNEILPATMYPQGDSDNLTTAEALSNLKIQEHWQEKGIALNYQIQKNINEVAYQKEKSAIQIEETVQKAQIRANVSLEKNLKQLEVIVLADGKLRLEQQRFGEPLQGILPFRIIFCKRYVPVFEEHPGILNVKFYEEEGGSKNFWLDLKEVVPRTINRKFTALGLSFGWAGQKEAQLRQRFIEQAVKLSEKIELPRAHGWYILDGSLQFAFPEALTWKEVTAYAG
ncbi:hypothetical protein [Candidatus Merdisoma sp. JLR.KK006]|uniref:hypothetical protein n=1 Tax=Candidatus Merdisoma sp. JLR.KK006 TaxID=3112626 RepID=UPI002FF0CF03